MATAAEANITFHLSKDQYTNLIVLVDFRWRKHQSTKRNNNELTKAMHTAGYPLTFDSTDVYNDPLYWGTISGPENQLAWLLLQIT